MANFLPVSGSDEGKKKKKKLFKKNFLERMSVNQRMVWYSVIRSTDDKCISNKAFSYHKYPGRAYDKTKATISRSRTDLVNKGYFEEYKCCTKCGREFNSLPEKCPNCGSQILDRDLELEVADNETNGKNPHHGVKPSRKAIKETDKLYLSTRDTLKKYKRARKAGIQYKILEYIIGIQRYDGNFKDQEERLPDLILTCLDGIYKEIKAIRKLWPKYHNNFDIIFWEEYKKFRRQIGNDRMLSSSLLKKIPKELEELRKCMEGFIE
jgi:predicted  nucleic acid-binding Zn-ribbon protein